jgi:hypothetical protein
MEYYEIYLSSANAVSGSTTPHSCRFNLGSVNNFIPNSYIFQKSNYCFVKVKYFSVEETATNFNSAGTGSLLIELNGALPNSIRSNALSTANPNNMKQSNIIGIVPTSIDKFSYSSNTFDNDFVKCNNILNGDITINIKDQNGAFITLTGSKPWNMLICVAFEKKPELLNHPNTGSTNYFSY